jgi:hypothetical protein
MTKFYLNEIPTIGETVQVIFTKYNEDHVVGELVDYTGEIIMVYSLATKKKKIKSYKNCIPLNKQVIAILEDFSSSTYQGSVSTAYVDVEKKPLFFNNNRLYKNFQKICSLTNTDFHSFWESYIYPYLEKEKDNFNIIREKLEDLSLPYNILTMANEKFVDKTKNNQTRKIVKILSMNGAKYTIQLIDKVKENPIYTDVGIKYKSAPEFEIISYQEKLIDEFIKNLIKESKNFNKIFIRN